MSECGSPSGQHIMEDCDCGSFCRLNVCIWCEYVAEAP